MTAAIVLWAWPESLPLWRSAAIVSAWAGSGLLAASLLLMVREPHLAHLLGGLENMYRWHHRSGILAYVLLLCHPLALTRVAVEFLVEKGSAGGSAVACTATVETVGPTGVEMEALTAVQVALLTIYDMCKAVDRGMTITGVRLLEKQGGKSGHYVAG